MEGRDIGTKVFPDADVKVFLDADPLVRERRRLAQQQLQAKPPNSAPPNFANAIAATALAPPRRWSRPRRCDLDSTSLSEDEVLGRIEQLVKQTQAQAR